MSCRIPSSGSGISADWTVAKYRLAEIIFGLLRISASRRSRTSHIPWPQRVQRPVGRSFARAPAAIPHFAATIPRAPAGHPGETPYRAGPPELPASGLAARTGDREHGHCFDVLQRQSSRGRASGYLQHDGHRPRKHRKGLRKSGGPLARIAAMGGSNNSRRESGHRAKENPAAAGGRSRSGPARRRNGLRPAAEPATESLPEISEADSASGTD